MTTSTDRQTFRETVAAIAALAKAKLPTQVNGRVESAVKLVLAHDVTRLEDGSTQVGSSTDPLKVYRLTGSTCDCQDFTRGQAPDGWCQHRIAAAIAKRVGELLPQGERTAQTSPDYQEKSDTTGQPASPALPEAPFSLTLKGTMDGVDALLTVRGMTAAAFQTNLATVRALLDTPAPPATQAPTQGQGKDWCGKHSVTMRWNEGKAGKRGWYSHSTDEGWCKGR